MWCRGLSSRVRFSKHVVNKSSSVYQSLRGVRLFFSKLACVLLRRAQRVSTQEWWWRW
jgi:hypothetical protein